MVARNGKTRKRFAALKMQGSEAEGAAGSDVAGLQPERRPWAIFGVPGRSRAAHVMQFRPVGIERLGEELAPEGFESAPRAGMAGDGCGKRGRCDRCHDAVSLFSFAAFAASGAFSASQQVFA